MEILHRGGEVPTLASLLTMEGILVNLLSTFELPTPRMFLLVRGLSPQGWIFSIYISMFKWKDEKNWNYGINCTSALVFVFKLIKWTLFKVRGHCSMKKGKKPTFRARVSLHPPTFRSVVYNCSVQSKANRFVFKQSYDFSVILLVSVVKKKDQVRYCFVVVRMCCWWWTHHHYDHLIIHVFIFNTVQFLTA